MLTDHNTGYTFMSANLTDRLHSAIARLSVNSRHRILRLLLAMGCVRSAFAFALRFWERRMSCPDSAIWLPEQAVVRFQG